MAKQELSFALYQLTLVRHTAPGTSSQELPWLDPYPLFKAELETQIGSGMLGTFELVRLESVEPNDGTRYISGFLHKGDHGQKKPIFTISKAEQTVTKTGEIGVDQTVPEKYFYSLFWPNGQDRGFLVLQQRINSTNIGYMKELLKKAIPSATHILREPLRLAPPDYLEKVNKGEIKKITFTKIVGPKTSLSGVENYGEVSEVGKATLIIEPSGKGSLNSFKPKLFGGGSKKPTAHASATEILDFNPESAKISIEFNGRTFTVSSDLEAVGRPAFLEEIEIGADGPVMSELTGFAESVIEAALAIPRS